MKPSIKYALAMLACASPVMTGLAADATPPANAGNAVKAPASPTLKMGDAAPEFKVTQWYKGGPVTLEADKTYIVECWATWCGPCVAAFPHLSEIAKANEGKITVIGVNVWERKKPEEVKTFVETQGDKMSYLVAADGENAIATHWLKAAGRNGIPCAFVVSKGKIAWIGHPASLKQELLTSIIDGTCDIAALAKAKEKEDASAKFLSQNVGPLLRKKDYAGAIVQLEAMKKEFPDQESKISQLIEKVKTMLPKETP
jgi:thiol-disulfide isomerase/thioredoxin